MFDQLVISGTTQKTIKPWTVALSAVVQLMILSVMILIPQAFTQVLPKRMLSTFLVAAAPPPALTAAPPPRPHPILKGAKNSPVFNTQKMVAPTAIRKSIDVIGKDEAPAIYADYGGGVGGDAGYDLGSLVGGGPLAPPPPPNAAPRRVRIGGDVQPPTLINQVMPQYPMIARTAHVSGTVVLHAIIAKDGTIEKLEFVSGPPLLMASAMDAVKRWRYKPALLDGEPIEIDTTVKVVFNLVVR